MSDLNSAINELKRELADGTEWTPELLKGIADDWDVNPALLIRKFKEATGKDPADYHVVSKKDLDKVMLDRARVLAKKTLSDYRALGMTGGVDILGKIFNYNGAGGQKKVGVSIAYTRDGIEFIRAEDGKHMVLRFPNQTVASNFIGKRLL
jgi:hypothetical protein